MEKDGSEVNWMLCRRTTYASDAKPAPGSGTPSHTPGAGSAGNNPSRFASRSPPEVRSFQTASRPERERACPGLCPEKSCLCGRAAALLPTSPPTGSPACAPSLTPSQSLYRSAEGWEDSVPFRLENSAAVSAERGFGKAPWPMTDEALGDVRSGGLYGGGRLLGPVRRRR